MAEDAFSQLDEDKQSAGGGDYAPWWNNDNFNRSEGDQIVGVVVEKHDYNDPGGDPHPVATLKAVKDCAIDKGEEVATPTHTTVEDIVQNLSVGDVLLLEYTGITKSQSGRDTNTYEFSVLKEEDWQDTDQAEDFQEVWDSWSPSEDNPAGGSGNSSAPSGGGSGGDDDQSALDFAEQTVEVKGGEMDVDELDEYVNDVRDYGVDIDSIIDVSEVLVRDGDTVSIAE